MHFKITAISLSVCAVFMLAWYVGLIPESLVPLVFVVVFVVAAHVFIDILISIGGYLLQLTKKNAKK